jgi:hypothetical protein
LTGQPAEHGAAEPARLPTDIRTDRHILKEKSGQAGCGGFTMAA